MNDLKDSCIVLYKVLYCTASGVVFPISLEQCRTKHYSEVMNVHLVLVRKPLHAETFESTGVDVRTHETCVRICSVACVSPVKVGDKGL